jgi:hypothetical protein
MLKDYLSFTLVRRGSRIEGITPTFESSGMDQRIQEAEFTTLGLVDELGVRSRVSPVQVSQLLGKRRLISGVENQPSFLATLVLQPLLIRSIQSIN